MILLDTHAAMWFVTADEALGEQSERLARRALADDHLTVSAISFWEITMLTAKRRLQATISPAEQRHRILIAGIQELPLTGDIAVLSVALEHFHGDPADRFIAATALAHDATLITADKRLLAWRHQMKRHNATR